MVKHVVKRDGRVVIFDKRKIVDAILKAMDVTEEGEDIVLAAEIASAISKINIDNMSVEDMKIAVKMAAGKAEIECSGNVTRENVARLVDIGVDYISSGALTHSSPILDLSLKNLHAV